MNFIGFIKGLLLQNESDRTKEVVVTVEDTATTGTRTTLTASQTEDRTVTLPDATDTLVGKTTTDTLENKTMDFSSAGNNTIVADAADVLYDNAASGLLGGDVQSVLDELDTAVDALETALADHEAATEAHGATGAVMGTTNEQTMTNKTVGDHLTYDEQASDPTAPAANKAQVYAKDVNGITRLYSQDSGGYITPLSGEVFYVVRNTSGSTINKGSAVYVTGATGSTSNVSPAQADSITTSRVIGIAAEDISNNGFGRIISKGLLQNFDTSAFAEGDSVFLSDSVAGGLTSTEPTHPNLAVRIGVITVSGAGNGSLEIDPASVEGDEKGTAENDWKIGDNAAGTKTVTFRNGNDLTLSAEPTTDRTLLLPDADGTLALDADLDALDTRVDDLEAGTASSADGTTILDDGTNISVNNTAFPGDLIPDSGGARDLGSNLNFWETINARRMQRTSGPIDIIANSYNRVASSTDDVQLDAAGATNLNVGAGTITANSKKINDVADPVDAQDAATKNYVDSHPLETMTEAERDAISSPATGRVILNTDTGKINVYDGSTWLELQTDAELAAHVADTGNPHSVTAAQVGNTTAQWNADKIQGADVPAPTSDEDGKALIYNHTSGDFEYGTAGGSGSGGINHIDTESSDFEEGIGSWTTYADAAGSEPVDGTGGTAVFVTLAQNTSTPLRGTGSLRFDYVGGAGAGSPGQGEGASIDFSIDKHDADEGIPQYISFDYKASAAYVTDDVLVFIVDRTSGEVITPTRSGSSYRFTGRFTPNTGNTDYRLCLHVASTTTEDWSLDIDNVRVGPSAILDLATGTVGEIIQYAGTTIPSDFLECNGTAVSRTTYSDLFAAIGTTWGVGDGSTTFNLPDFESANRFLRAAGGSLSVGTYQDDAFASHNHDLKTDGTTVLGANSGGGGVLAANSPLGVRSEGAATVNTLTEAIQNEGGSETRPTNAAVKMLIRYRGKGALMSTTEMLNVAGKVSYGMTTSQSISTATTTILNFDDEISDELGLVTTGAAWKYTARTKGRVTVNAGLRVLNQAGWEQRESIEILAYVNGSQTKVLAFAGHPTSDASADGAYDVWCIGSAQVDLEVGDELDLRVLHHNDATVSIDTNAAYTFVDIVTNPDLTVIGATHEKVYGSIATSTTTVSSTVTQIAFGSAHKDTHNGFSGNQYTVQVPGDYEVTAQFVALATGGNFNGTGERAFLNVYKNGVDAGPLYAIVPPSGNTTIYPNGTVYLEDLVAGDVLTIYGQDQSGASNSWGAAGKITIRRVV